MEETKDTFREGWIMVDKIPTRIFSWGTWIEDIKEGEKNMIFLIPGNPGITEFYVEFLNQIYDRLRIPICIASHAGHESPTHPKFYEEYTLYTLEMQIYHKEYILKKYVPKGCKVFIIAHSMGSKVTLELLKKPEIEEKIAKAYLLFPAIERFSETKNAKTLRLCSNKKIMQFYLFFVQVFQLLPESLVYYMTYAGLAVARGVTSPPINVVTGVLQMIKPPSLENMQYLAVEEMKHIKELDVDTVTKYKHKLKFYYGTDDGWCPLEHYENIKKCVPGVDATLCDKKIEHAFMVKTPHHMGDIMSDWVEKDMVSC